MANILPKLQKLKLLLLDFDGVIVPSCNMLSDEQLKECLSMLNADVILADKIGIRLGVISLCTDKSIIDGIKAAGIKDIITGSMNKLDEAEVFLKKLNVGFDETGYIGDDLLDIPLLQKAGFSAAPESARREVKRTVDYICKNLGGKSAAGTVLSLIKEVKK